MSRVVDFLFRRRGGKGWHWTDIVTWVWLIGGLFMMFGPALWLVGSSFKTPAALAEFPPTLLPYVTQQVEVEGYDKPLPLYDVDARRTARRAMLAEVRRIGLVAQMVDPANPGRDHQGRYRQAQAGARRSRSPLDNYTEPFVAFRLLPLPLEFGLRHRRWRR